MNERDRRDFVPRMIETPAFAQRSGFRDEVQSQINAIARACGGRDQVGAVGTTLFSVVWRRTAGPDAARAPMALRSPGMFTGNHPRGILEFNPHC